MKITLRVPVEVPPEGSGLPLIIRAGDRCYAVDTHPGETHEQTLARVRSACERDDDDVSVVLVATTPVDVSIP